MSGGTEAWVTLATNDSYAMGALVLAKSLTRVNTTKQLCLMITPGVSTAMRDVLNGVFDVVTEVNILDSEDAAHLALLDRPELGITFTKIHCWKLTQFTKCVFLDADTLVIQNSDELFEREELSAAPDVGWPDCFNSGVFVFTPSVDTYNNIHAFALSNGSFDGGDQGLLNMYFNGWSQADSSRRLPFIYNMVASASYSYLPAFKVFGQNVKIVHFIGQEKPWLTSLDTATGVVRPPGGQEHLQNFLQAWWDIFRSEVHPKLSPEMEGDQNQSATMVEQVQATFSQIFVSTEPSASQFSFQPPPSLPQQAESPEEPQEHVPEAQPPPPSEPPLLVAIERFPPDHFWRAPPSPPPPIPEYQRPTSPPPPDTHQSSTASDGDNNSNRHASPNDHSQSSDRPPSNEEKKSRKKRPKPKGIAAIYAKMSLDGGKSEDQIEYEDHMRKLAWEQGHMDYMGKDSFDNIMKRIQVSMAQTNVDRPRKRTPPKQEPQAAAPPQQPAPEAQKVPTEPVQKQASSDAAAKAAEKLAQEERLAIEKKIAEQKKAAEQKLEAERQAAAASAPPEAAKVVDPKAPPRKELTSILKKPAPILKDTTSTKSPPVPKEESSKKVNNSAEEKVKSLKTSKPTIEQEITPVVETVKQETVTAMKKQPVRNDESDKPKAVVAEKEIPQKVAKESEILSSKSTGATAPPKSKENGKDQKVEDIISQVEKEIISDEKPAAETVVKKSESIPMSSKASPKDIPTEEKIVKAQVASASESQKPKSQKEEKQADGNVTDSDKAGKEAPSSQVGSHEKNDVQAKPKKEPAVKVKESSTKPSTVQKPEFPPPATKSKPTDLAQEPKSTVQEKVTPKVETPIANQSEKSIAKETVIESEIVATSVTTQSVEIPKQETWSQKVAKSKKVERTPSQESIPKEKLIPKKVEPQNSQPKTQPSAPKEPPTEKDHPKPQFKEPAVQKSTSQPKEKLPQKEVVQTKEKLPSKAVEPVKEQVPTKEVPRPKEVAPPKEVPAPKDKPQPKEPPAQKKKQQQKENKPVQKPQDEKPQPKEMSAKNDKSGQKQKSQQKDSSASETPSPEDLSPQNEKPGQKGKQIQQQKEAPPKKEKLSKKQKAAQREALRNANSNEQPGGRAVANPSPYGVGLGVLGAAVILVFAIYAGYSPASFIL